LVAHAICAVTINRDPTGVAPFRTRRGRLAAFAKLRRVRYRDFRAQHLLIVLLALSVPAMSGLADPAQTDVKKPVAAAGSPSPYAVINHLDDADQQVSVKDGKLLTHRHKTDPFGIAINGKFKGLPAIVDHPANNQPAVAPDAATFEKAVQQLTIGGVDVAGREALIGFRSVHEGDLVVLELGGRQFAAWVQSIDQRGVQFCDVYLQRRATKTFRFGPSELPDSFADQQTTVGDFLKQDGQ
jgi:hypothetical protein